MDQSKHRIIIINKIVLKKDQKKYIIFIKNVFYGLEKDGDIQNYLRKNIYDKY